MPQNQLWRRVAPRRFLPSSPLLYVVGLAIGCADRGPPTDETPSRKPLLVGARVVRAPENPRFHADTQLTFQGRRVEGACVFEREVTLSLGEHVVERVAEYDLDTCLYVVERGDYDHTSDAHLHRDTSSTTRVLLGAPRPSSSVRGGSRSPMFFSTMTTSSCARSHYWFEDPIGIDVTRSELHVIWEWDGAQVWSSWAEHAYGAYASSGWHMIWNNLESHFLYEGGAVETNAYATMENGSFPCPEPAPTWTYYTPNTMTTWGYGNVTFYSSVYAAGGCSNWLTLYNEYWTEY